LVGFSSLLLLSMVLPSARDALEVNSIFLRVCQHLRWTQDEQGLGNTLTF